MKIGLLGFTFENANKGCEALTYSFLYMIAKVFGEDVEICYYSHSNAMGKVKDYFPNMVFTHQPLTRKDMLLRLNRSFKTCDIVYDISYGDGFADIYNPRGVFRNTLIKQQVNFSKTPLVLLPQTYGPFNKIFLERQAANAIKHADQVFSRDALSTEYVKKISGKKAVTVTDLAFALPYKADRVKKDETKVALGINVSGLLWKGGFYKENQFGLTVDYRRYIMEIIEYYVNQPEYEVHLVPHVIETVSGSNDGDLYVNELLCEKYPTLIKAPAFEDPCQTKNYIAGLDVTTAARMHATVDSFSAGVPVIPFAYSRKFEGLYGSLGYPYLIDGCKMDTESAVAKTIELINQRDVLLSDVRRCMVNVAQLTDSFLRELLSVQK